MVRPNALAIALVCTLIAVPVSAGGNGTPTASKGKDDSRVTLAFSSYGFPRNDCPVWEKVEAHITAAFGYQVFKPEGEDMLSVQVRDKAGGYAATIEILSKSWRPKWSREVEHPYSCSVLMQDVAAALRLHYSASDSALEALSQPTIAGQAQEEPKSFNDWMAHGDESRRKGNLAGAIDAYKHAYGIKHDLTARARMALAYVALGRCLHIVVPWLLDAINGNAGESEEERAAYKKAFKIAMSQICTLTLVTDSPEASFSITQIPPNPEQDEVFKNFSIGPSATFYFAPGRMAVTGTLAGAAEFRNEFDCLPNEPKTIRMEWGDRRPIPAPADSPTDPYLKALAIVDDRSEPDREYDGSSQGIGSESRRSRSHGFIGAGPVAVLGAASWLPALGASVSGGLRWGAFSIDLDGRAAWLVSTIADHNIRAMTGGALLGACGHYQWAFACGVVHLGVVQVDASEYTYRDARTFSFLKFGAGGRVGIDIPVSGPIAIRVTADVIGLSSGTRVQLGQTVLTDHPPVMVGSNVAAIYRF
jgi:hypothetical protein